MAVHDRAFVYFAGALLAIVALFGVGTLAVVFWGDHVLALRLVNVFAGMFSAVVGLGAGYLLGRRTASDDGTP